MFKCYADLFSDEEKKAKQQARQQKQREWRAAQAQNLVNHAEAGNVKEPA